MWKWSNLISGVANVPSDAGVCQVNFGMLALEIGTGPSTDIGFDARPNIMGHNGTLGGSYPGMG